MKNIINEIKVFFDSMDWKYSYDETKSLFSAGISMHNSVGNVALKIIVKETRYTVYAILNNKVESKFLPQVAEYLHRANYCLLNGNFEIDYSDGEIRYKTYVNFENAKLSKEIIADSILLPIFMFDKYGKNLLKLMVDVGDPHQLILDAEKEEKETT